MSEKFEITQKIIYNEPMRNHTSFKIGGNADLFVSVVNEDELKEALNYAKLKNLPITIIGNGSNLLVSDNGIRGLVIKIDIQLLKIENNKKEIVVTVGSGNKIMALGIQLKEKEISGFEELSGIPGTIGGAVFMNAGAYGKEMKDIVVSTKCMNREGKVLELSNEEQKFEYRSSIFNQEEYIILETKLKLKSINNNKDIITSAKNKNSNQSPINNINIFQLNNSESDMPNNNIRKEKIKINNMKNALMNQRSNTMNDLNKYNDNELLKINKTVPKINIDNQVFLSLKKEENIVNRLFQKISNDNLFFSKIINEDNKLKNLKLKEKSKILKSNNSYNGDIYDNWKTFHLNTNIDSISHRKKLSKINWYKNIDKFPYNSDENKESITNRIFYGIQVDKKRVTFIEDKIFYKNNSFLHTENEKYKI